MSAANVALFVVYTFVCGYFLRRFIRFGKAPSLGIALLPSGWIALALESDLGSKELLIVKWVGVLIGVALLTSVHHADRTERR